MSVHALLEMTLSGLGDLAKADVVTGKPMTVGSKTIVPVLKMAVGFGGGGGEGEGEAKERKSGGGKGMGSGAGGGVHLAPVAVIVKDENGVKVLPVPCAKKGIEKLMDKIPALVEKVKAMKEG